MNKAVKILLLFLLFTVTAIITVRLTGTQDAMEGWNNDPEELLRRLRHLLPADIGALTQVFLITEFDVVE